MTKKRKSNETVNTDRTIRCKVRIEKQFYPKDQPIEDGDFGIVSARVLWFDETYTIPEVHPFFKTINIKGNLPAMEAGNGVEYMLQAWETVSDYGTSYTVKLMSELVELETREQQYAFLSQILTERQTTNLFNTFEKPIDIIKAGHHEELLKVPGIGEVALQKLLKRVIATEDLAIIYTELGEYELTKREIDELVMAYRNPRLVVDEFKKNPYVLMDHVSRVGFSRADEVALKGKFNRRSHLRVKAFILDYLNTQAEQGNSWVYFNQMLQAIDEQFANDVITDEILSKALKLLVKQKQMWHNEDKTKVALQWIYQLEQDVADELLRLHQAPSEFDINNWEQTILEQEARQGWQYTKEQRSGIEKILKNNVVLIQGLAGCVDADTEFFNGKQWKKISEYEAGEQVLQYHEDGSTSLVTPIKYHKNKQDKLYHFKTKYGLDQCLSKDHRIIYQSKRGNLLSKTMEEMMALHEANQSGFSGKFMTTFVYSGQGIGLTDEEIRVMCAVIGDGYFKKDRESNGCTINLKKERKKIRLEQLLTEAGIPYSKQENSAPGYHRYYFQAPLRLKTFDSSWYQCSQEQLQIIADEIIHWDGSLSGNRIRFSTTDKQTADFVQFVFSSNGYRTTINTYDRTGQIHTVKTDEEKHYIRQSVEYELSMTKRHLISLNGGENKTKIEEVKTKDGYEYCFSVPSEMLVLRRNGRIFITGNCGKTATVAGMLAVLDDKYEVTSCALSGKAAVNISDSVAQNGLTLEGKTIHRLLKNKGQEGVFGRDKHNPLPDDIIILDEISMVDVRIFLSLLRAIKNGSKLIMLGDNGQLPPIGIGNLMTSLIEAKVIPTVTLTKVHRQAAKSGIISESLKIRQGTDLVSTKEAGVKVCGELQDLILDTTTNQDEVFEKIIKHFKNEWEQLDDIMDILIVLPMRERGRSSVYKINNAIQSYLYRGTFNRGYMVNEGKSSEFKIYPGDKVLCNKNDYEVLTPDGSETAIFNGNLGLVKWINHDLHQMLIDFEGIGEVLLERHQIETLSLGYAISIHKSQGIGVPVVIAAFTMESWILLSRQLVYTAMTRAKKKGIVVAEIKALRTAARKNGVVDKQTFLEYLLTNTPL